MEFPSLTFLFRVKRNYDFSSIRQIWVYFPNEPGEQWKFHLLSEMERPNQWEHETKPGMSGWVQKEPVSLCWMNTAKWFPRAMGTAQDAPTVSIKLGRHRERVAGGKSDHTQRNGGWLFKICFQHRLWNLLFKEGASLLWLNLWWLSYNNNNSD